MLSRFHLILERYGWTDGRTDRRTDLLYQYRTSVCWCAIIKIRRFGCSIRQVPAPAMHLDLAIANVDKATMASLSLFVSLLIFDGEWLQLWPYLSVFNIFLNLSLKQFIRKHKRVLGVGQWPLCPHLMLMSTLTNKTKTRLGRAHVLPSKVFRRVGE